MTRPSQRALFATVTVGIVLATTVGCIPVPRFSLPGAERAPEPLPSVSPKPTTSPAPSQSADASNGDGDVLAERDRFIQAQQLPLDGSPLVAVTPEQKEFIRQQREYVESQGSSWTSDDESIALALASDACETAILNHHRVDADLLKTHVATSPLFSALIPADASESDRAGAEASIASVMAFGTTFLCPADGDSWIAAYREVYRG